MGPHTNLKMINVLEKKPENNFGYYIALANETYHKPYQVEWRAASASQCQRNGLPLKDALEVLHYY